MYWNILKKDLKRKKIMNLVLFLFIVMAVAFVATGVNNIISITTAVDRFYEIENVPDYFFMTRGMSTLGEGGEKIGTLDHVEDYDCEEVIFLMQKVKVNGEENKKTVGSIVCSFEQSSLTYFTQDDEELKEVKKDEIYVATKQLTDGSYKIGDKVTIELNEKEYEFKVAGGVKDAILGSPMVGNARLIVNEEVFKDMVGGEEGTMYAGNMVYILTDDAEAFQKDVNANVDQIIFADTTEHLKMVYVMDMIVAAIFLILSVFLLIMAFIVLRFSISYTLEEEFREIGIMKAIGIPDRNIRKLHLVKYLGIAVIAAVIGFFISIPLCDLMIDSVSKNIVISTGNNVMLNAVISALVVMIVLLFALQCTGKIKKCTPLDAIRSGENGERFRKKSMITLSGSGLKPYVFLAVNDIFSSMKRYVSMLLLFTVSLTAIAILSSTSATISSDEMVRAIGIKPSDYYMGYDEEATELFEITSKEEFEEKCIEIENDLKENGLDAYVYLESTFKNSFKNGDNVCNSIVFWGARTKAEDYSYKEGSGPKAVDEVAISSVISDKLRAQVGDTIIMTSHGKDEKVLVTGIFDSVMNMGEGVRLYEEAEPDFSTLIGFLSYQLEFEEDLDQDQEKEMIEIVKEIYPKATIYTPKEYTDKMSGYVATTMDQVKLGVIGVVIFLIVFMIMLMERSFVSKERREIALLKAIGFQDKVLVKYHCVRMMTVMLISTIIMMIISGPLTILVDKPIFKMMGCWEMNIKMDYLGNFVVYPLLLLAVTGFATFLTAQFIRTISANDVSNNVE